MGVSKIEGTVEAAEMGRSRPNQTIFKSATFRLNDGSAKVLPKFVAATPLIGELTPGASGRYYHFKAVDHQGIFGVRTQDGRAVFDYPRANERLFMVVVIVNVLWVCLRLFIIGDGIPLLGVALMIFGGVFWFLNRQLYGEAKALFDKDGAA